MSPLALDPDSTFEVVLESDKEKPEGRRPVFTFRFRSLTEWSAAERSVQGMDESADGQAALMRLAEAINGGLVGWSNMINESGRTITIEGPQGPAEIGDGEHIPYAPEALKSVVTAGEAWDLYYSALRNGMAAVIDLKKSASQSPTSTDESAADAKAEPSMDIEGA